MQFPTLSFVTFFLVALTVSWSVRRNRVLQKWWLLLASAFFYTRLDGGLALLLFGTALSEYAISEVLLRRTSERWRLGWMWVSVLKNCALLGVFKYFNFFAESVQVAAAALGMELYAPVLDLLFPLGLSFYGLQCMAYTVDLQRGHGHRARSLLDFLVFVTFFPQLLIGPICRSRDLLPQLEAPAPDAIPDLSIAVSLLASGLFKKVVLATMLGTALVNSAFQYPADYASLELLVAAYAYCIMIYCDFSGYTDLARGLGLLMGFQLPENFNQPYRATNISDFWRRWHITFSNWLRDYIYLPLGGSRAHPLRVYTNLMITLLVAGLWHGSAWKFVMWGFLHGCGIVAYKMLQDWRRSRGLDPKTMVHPVYWVVTSWLLTLHLNVFARIFFYSPDMASALVYLRELAVLDTLGQGVPTYLLPVIAFGFSMHFWGQHYRRWFVALHERTPGLLRPVLWVGIGVAVFAAQPDDIAPFIYFAF